VQALPRLGVGVSTEYGAFAGPGGLELATLVAEHPGWAGFLELGVEVEKGLDDAALAWVAAGRPTTHHFLDINLDDPRDFDPAWLLALQALLLQTGAAWLCGDAGLWHLGPRDRAHMLLLPPILTDASASALALGVARLREATGREVLPENPPGTAFVGELHLLDYFARVLARADTGMLLDVAHLALYQRLQGKPPLHGLDAFPLERVVELHVAGGVEREVDGFSFVDDAHGTAVLEDTWQIYEWVAPRAPNLKAVVFECERNTNAAVAPGFARIARSFPAG
jgi:uncharacterized protein